MDTILLTRELTAQGLSQTEIETMVRTGALVRLRRGAYVSGSAPAPGSDRAQHRQLIESTIGQSQEGTIVSHMSAAALHGLPIWRDQLDRVSVIRDRDGGGRARRYVRVRGMPLAPEDVVVVDGIATTSLARTVVDLACQLSLRRSVAIGDAALRLASSDEGRDVRAELDRALQRAVRRPGVPTARRAVAFLDGRSESPGESESRVVLREHGLPAPELQYEIYDDNGFLVARTDFAWPDRRTVGEFDGAVKYSGQFGKPVEQVVLDEKRRENAIRAYGFDVVRWTWSDLRQPAPFVSLLRRSLARQIA